MPTFERRIIDKTWHKGPIHQPAPGGHYDNFRDGMADNYTYMRGDVKNVAHIRDPATTPRLSDLELEFGIKTDQNLSEATRIELLNVERYKKKTTAQIDELQRRLIRGGFDLLTYNNSPEGPAIDPALIIDSNFQMQAMEGTNYYAGNTLAYAGQLGGYWLVNGRLFTQFPGYLGAGTMWAGNTKSKAGYYDNFIQDTIIYETPTNPIDWPFCFFVGGVATYNPDLSLATIEQAFVPQEQQKQLEDIVLKFKPAFSWAAMMITFT